MPTPGLPGRSLVKVDREPRKHRRHAPCWDWASGGTSAGTPTQKPEPLIVPELLHERVELGHELTIAGNPARRFAFFGGHVVRPIPA